MQSNLMYNITSLCDLMGKIDNDFSLKEEFIIQYVIRYKIATRLYARVYIYNYCEENKMTLLAALRTIYIRMERSPIKVSYTLISHYYYCRNFRYYFFFSPTMFISIINNTVISQCSFTPTHVVLKRYEINFARSDGSFIQYM